MLPPGAPVSLQLPAFWSKRRNAQSATGQKVTICSACQIKASELCFNKRLFVVNQLIYREEDRFREESNKRRLKELHRAGDINGLFEFAVLLNYQASSANSKIHWIMREHLSTAFPVAKEHMDAALEFTDAIESKQQDNKANG